MGAGSTPFMCLKCLSMNWIIGITIFICNNKSYTTQFNVDRFDFECLIINTSYNHAFVVSFGVQDHINAIIKTKLKIGR